MVARKRSRCFLLVLSALERGKARLDSQVIRCIGSSILHPDREVPGSFTEKKTREVSDREKTEPWEREEEEKNKAEKWQ